MKLEVFNVQGDKTGRQIDLPEDIFGIEPNEHVLYLAVKAYNANQRQGTHKAKERNEIAGSTKKIKRQKGTGTARFGDIKNPIFRGGGRIFGPRPRSYGQKMNKKVKALARKSALSAKFKAEELIVLEDFTFETPKTSAYVEILNNLSIGDKKSLLVVGEYDKTVLLSSRNLQKAQVTRATDLNVYDMLNSNVVVLSESAIEKIKESFAEGTKA
ncbi:MAG: 50S ribosomal protein L4 [Bacteroidota bacterium]